MGGRCQKLIIKEIWDNFNEIFVKTELLDIKEKLGKKLNSKKY